MPSLRARGLKSNIQASVCVCQSASEIPGSQSISCKRGGDGARRASGVGFYELPYARRSSRRSTGQRREGARTGNYYSSSCVSSLSIYLRFRWLFLSRARARFGIRDCWPALFLHLACFLFFVSCQQHVGLPFPCSSSDLYAIICLSVCRRRNHLFEQREKRIEQEHERHYRLVFAFHSIVFLCVTGDELASARLFTRLPT